MPEDELELVARAKANPEAFGPLYERYLGRVYNYIYHRTGSVSEAEDLTERVFLQALSHLPSYTYRGLPFSVWLFRIAHNVLANWYRDGKRRQTVSIDDQIAAGEEPTNGFDDIDIEDDHFGADKMEIIRFCPVQNKMPLPAILVYCRYHPHQ